MTDTSGEDRTLHADSTPPSASDLDAHHVDVTAATSQFNELQRVLLLRSQQADSGSERTRSLSGKDLEKSADDDAEAFDLHAYLTSCND